MGVLAGSLLARAVAHGAPNGQTGAATVPGNQTPKTPRPKPPKEESIDGASVAQGTETAQERRDKRGG